MDSVKELEKIIVHSDEAGMVELNPETHSVRVELIPGGNVIVHVRPIEDQFQPGTLVDL